jgi:capsular polysaccharide biosynthesis protein
MLAIVVEGVPKAPMSVDRGMVARTALGALLIAIPAALIAILVSLLRTPAYEASAQVWVKHVGLLQQTYPTGSAEQIQAPPPIGGLQALMPTMIQVAGSHSVAEETARRLGSPTDSAELLDNLTIEQVENTNRIRLTYEDTKPEKVQRSWAHSPRCPPSASPKQKWLRATT